MTNRPGREEFQQRAVGYLINRYLTFYAVVLILLGVAAEGKTPVSGLALGILAVTTAGNWILTTMMRRKASQIVLIRNVRIAFNYLFNIPLVYLLWPSWPPVWMLLMLSMVNVAIFEDIKTTAGTAGLFTIVLAYVHYMRGDHTAPQLLQTAVYAVTLWTAGLLINRIYHPNKDS